MVRGLFDSQQDKYFTGINNQYTYLLLSSYSNDNAYILQSIDTKSRTDLVECLDHDALQMFINTVEASIVIDSLSELMVVLASVEFMMLALVMLLVLLLLAVVLLLAMTAWVVVVMAAFLMAAVLLLAVMLLLLMAVLGVVSKTSFSVAAVLLVSPITASAVLLVRPKSTGEGCTLSLSPDGKVTS